jgi:tetrapyrrole methylase family protein/MazG family protein
MSESFDKLIDAVRKNRKYSPWAKIQKIDTYIHQLTSEVDEVKEAIENNDIENLKEELGDVLWDLLNMFIICEDNHNFNMDDSINNVIQKMKNRKPHIFEGREISPEEEEIIFKERKAEEKMIKND